ncbi:hypothetical protein Hanom_Chr12g01155181 [Helianthus anomalus]
MLKMVPVMFNLVRIFQRFRVNPGQTQSDLLWMRVQIHCGSSCRFNEAAGQQLGSGRLWFGYYSADRFGPGPIRGRRGSSCFGAARFRVLPVRFSVQHFGSDRLGQTESTQLTRSTQTTLSANGTKILGNS